MVNTLYCLDHIRHLVCIECVIFWYPHTHVLCMGSGSATGFFYQVRLVHSSLSAFFTEIFFQISVVILNSNLHYQIFKFVIDIILILV